MTRKRWSVEEKVYDDVIFRVFPETGEVVALFPGFPADMEGGITSYMEVGQHGAADYEYVMSKTVPASRGEYAFLKQELEDIGYVLKVHSTRTRKMIRNFVEILSEWHSL